MYQEESPFFGKSPVILISGYRGLAETLIAKLDSVGAHLSVLVRRAEALEPLRKKYESHLFVAGDVTNGYDCERWFKQTHSKFGRIDCLINNAAINGPLGKLHEIDFEQFRVAIETNLIAPTRLSHQVLPFFLEQKRGVIINLSGGGATQARPNFSGYSLSKCALVRLTENLAEEYPELRFYSISPGPMNTPMMQSIVQQSADRVGSEYEKCRRYVSEGAEDPAKAAELIHWLIERAPQELSGKLISAIWDDYKNFPNQPNNDFWWTLRRVDEICQKNLSSLS